MADADPGPPLGTLLAADAVRSRRLQESRFGYRPRTWWLDPGFLAVFFFRLGHAAYRRGGYLRARLLYLLNSLVTGADFHPAARIGPGFLVPSPFSTNISCNAGSNLTLMGQAGIGGSGQNTDVGAGPGLPLLGNGVTAERFCGLNGPFVYADGSRVVAGAGSVRGAGPGETVRPTVAPEVRARTDVPTGVRSSDARCPHVSLRVTLRNWREDLRRYADELQRHDPKPVTARKMISAAFYANTLALLCQRLAHWLHCRGWRRFGRLLAGTNTLIWKLSMPAETCIGGGVLMPHLAGLVVDGRFGARLTFYANIVCAGWDAHPGTGPLIGDDATIGGHAGAFGSIRLGDGVHLSPKVQLAQDASEGVQVFSRSAYARASLETEEKDTRASSSDGAKPAVPDLKQLHLADRARWRAMKERGGQVGFFGRAAVRLHRRAHDWHGRGRLRLARLAWLTNAYLTGADISPASRIGGGMLLPYPAGISFHGTAGRDLTIMAMSGVGAALDEQDRLPPLDAAPILGDRVRLDHHSQIDGAVRIGNDCRVMPGCNAYSDLAAGQELAMYAVRLRRPGSPETVAKR